MKVEMCEYRTYVDFIEFWLKMKVEMCEYRTFIIKYVISLFKTPILIERTMINVKKDFIIKLLTI